MKEELEKQVEIVENDRHLYYEESNFKVKIEIFFQIIIKNYKNHIVDNCL